MLRDVPMGGVKVITWVSGLIMYQLTTGIIIRVRGFRLGVSKLGIIALLRGFLI